MKKINSFFHNREKKQITWICLNKALFQDFKTFLLLPYPSLRGFRQGPLDRTVEKKKEKKKKKKKA